MSWAVAFAAAKASKRVPSARMSSYWTGVSFRNGRTVNVAVSRVAVTFQVAATSPSASTARGCSMVPAKP
jgi:hypothetical protein